MTLAHLTRTSIVLDVDESLLVGLPEWRADMMRHLEIRCAPAKGGLVLNDELFLHPVGLVIKLWGLADECALTAKVMGDNATGRYYSDRASFYNAAADHVLSLSFIQRYWPDVADAIDNDGPVLAPVALEVAP